jgi:hypothetical protein
MSQKPGVVVTLPYGMQLSQENLHQINDLVHSLTDNLKSLFGNREHEEGLRPFAYKIQDDGTFVADEEVPEYVKAFGLPDDLKGRSINLSYRDCGPDTTSVHEATARIRKVKVRRGYYLELHLEGAPEIILGKWGVYRLGALKLHLTKSLGGRNEDGTMLWSIYLGIEGKGDSVPVKELKVEIMNIRRTP